MVSPPSASPGEGSPSAHDPLGSPGLHASTSAAVLLPASAPCTAPPLLVFPLKCPHVPRAREAAGVHTSPALSCSFSLRSKCLDMLHQSCSPPLQGGHSLPLPAVGRGGCPWASVPGCFLGRPCQGPPSCLTCPALSHLPQPHRDGWVCKDGKQRPAWGLWLGLDGPQAPAGLTWGWKSNGDGLRYFSLRAPTGSVTFRFSTLLDSNTEGYGPH